MSTESNSELVQFQQFIVDRLQQGEPISPEEALDLWRISNPRPDVSAADIAAVRAALADLDAGQRGVPLDEFAREFRIRHGISEA